MSMPLPAERLSSFSFWGMSSLLRTAVRLDLWWFQAGSVFSNCLTDGLDVSPLGGFCGSSWIFSHSGHHCKGRASITPLTIRGLPMSMPLLLSGWVSFHSEEWVLHSPELVIGRASIAPLVRGSPLSMPLPAERLSSHSFWGMSSPLLRALW